MDIRPISEDSDMPGDEEVLRDAMESLSEGIAIYDAERRLVTFNERYQEMLWPIAELIAPGLRWEDKLQACAAGGVYADADGRETEWLANVRGSGPGEAEIAQSDGHVYLVRYTPTSTGGFVVIRTDITERREAERRLQERERLLATVLESNPLPVVMARLSDGEILYRSPAARELYGATSHARAHYVYPEEREAYVKALRVNGGVDDFRETLRDVKGREFPASVTGRLTEFNGEIFVVSTTIDLSEQNRRESMIRKVVENCPAPILMTDVESGRVLFRSSDIGNLYEEVQNARDFYVDPADRAGFLAALRRDGAVTDYKARFRNAYGKPYWGAISARLIDYEGREVIVSYSRDMTEQLEIEVELTRQRERLFQNEKMSALGGLLANVSHALNNPLSVVIGHALMLQEEGGDPDVIRQAKKIGEAADRCAEIVRNYLTMAREDPGEMAAAEINEIVGTAVDVVRHGEAATEPAIETSLAEDLPEVLADADQIAQVVISLLVNARQAILAQGRGSVIRVATSRAAGGKHVRISVEDDGPGIAPDVARKIFEPFFSTRAIGDGAGIGLSYCHRIIHDHHGQIRLDESYHGGARFLIDLPVADDAVAPEPAAEPAPTLRRVLVIDDERDVADLNAEVLDRAGFAAEVAYSGAEAVELLGRKHFDCVLSDLNMPGVDGRAIFEAIRHEFPELLPRTGFITGDTMGRASQGFLLETRRPYLEKPVSPKELRDFVAELLEGGRQTL